MNENIDIADFERRVLRIEAIVRREEKLQGPGAVFCVRGRHAIADGRRKLDMLREEAAALESVEATTPPTSEKLKATLEKFLRRRDEIQKGIVVLQAAIDDGEIGFPDAIAECKERLVHVEASIVKLYAAIEAKPPTKKASRKSSIGSLLASAGLAFLDRNTGDHYLLEWTGAVPNPSTVYRHPMSYVPSSESDSGQEQIWLVHETLAEHPQVTLLEAVISRKLEVWTRGSPGNHWATRASWRHAQDLATDEHYRALIETQHLTTVSDIDSAVAMHLGSPDHRKGRKPVLSIANARRILDEAGLGFEDHARSMTLIYGEGLQVSPGAEYHPKTRLGVAWMVIHGLEDGLLVRERDGFIRLSPALAAARAPMWNAKVAA